MRAVRRIGYAVATAAIAFAMTVPVATSASAAEVSAGVMPAAVDSRCSTTSSTPGKLASGNVQSTATMSCGGWQGVSSISVGVEYHLPVAGWKQHAWASTIITVPKQYYYARTETATATCNVTGTSVWRTKGTFQDRNNGTTVKYSPSRNLGFC